MQHVLDRPLAITMWDFSWLERRWSGGGYEDWGLALDELVERGYNAVRIDAFPHLAAQGPEATWSLVPVWDQEAWGATEPVSVQVFPALTEFLSCCRDRKILVALSSWFREDTNDVRMKLTSPEALAAAWDTTLQLVKDAGLADTLYYVDLVNEWPLPIWAPFLFRGMQAPRVPSRAEDRVAAFGEQAVALLRAAHPEFRYTLSFSDEISGVTGENLDFLDLLEVHIWMSHHEVSDFAARSGYDIATSRFDPRGYIPLSGPAEALYRSDPSHWQDLLRQQISTTAEWGRRAGKPLATTECWGVINFKDGPGRDWSWVKELCAVGVEAASQTGQWEALATSNFCGPQFVGMWRDVAWHRQMTDRIKRASIAAPLTAIE